MPPCANPRRIALPGLLRSKAADVMAKKYLSIDEAASILGLTAAQVRRAIDRRELHAYKDGASFKLSEQQVEEYRRSQQTDSSPEFPLLSGDQDSDDAGQIDLSSSDSDVRLMADEPGPKRGKLDDLVNSGSDVRLSGDSGPRLGVGRDDLISLSDSDSDVRLAQGSDSDSDVRLSDALDATGEIPAGALDSDSDVKLFGSDNLLGDDSDSDVKLSGGRTDSDIRLADEPSRPSPALLPDDSDLKLINRPSSVRVNEPDSGISLDVRGSGLGLAGADSGISLELDSGISLDANDSGISLESFDSRTKAGGDDSGISLDSGDSGISLDLDDDTGPAPVDTSRTQPMQVVPGARRSLADSSKTTQLEVPKAGVGKDSEFELAGLDDDDALGTSTSVLTFDDDDLGDSRTLTDSSLGDSSGLIDEAPATEEEYADEYTGDDYDEQSGGGDEYEDFDDAVDGEEGESAGFASGTGTAAAPTAFRRAEVDWGMGIKTMIGFSAVLGIVCCVVGVELIRTMWIWTQPGNSAEASPVLSLISGMF